MLYVPDTMVIFLYGADAFRSSQKAAEIKKKFLASDTVGSGLSVFDYGPASTRSPRFDNRVEAGRDRSSTRGGEKNSQLKLLDVLGTPNLLSPKRLVVVKNLISGGSDSEQEEILEYLKKNKNLAEDNDLGVVFLESGQPKKSSALFKFLEKSASQRSKSQNFEKLSGIKLSQWALKRIKDADKEASISKSAMEKLVAYAGEDMFSLDKEIMKLVNFASGRMIQEEDIDLLVKANLDSNIFATIDALGNRDKRLALKLLHRHLEGGEDPFYLLSMFVYQFRNLLKVADLKENQKAEEYEIARISKLHPFVVKKSLAQLRNFSWESLLKIYQKLGNIDTAAKTGKMEIKLALDKFIVEL